MLAWWEVRLPPEIPRIFHLHSVYDYEWLNRFVIRDLVLDAGKSYGEVYHSSVPPPRGSEGDTVHCVCVSVEKGNLDPLWHGIRWTCVSVNGLESWDILWLFIRFITRLMTFFFGGLLGL